MIYCRMAEYLLKKLSLLTYLTLLLNILYISNNNSHNNLGNNIIKAINEYIHKVPNYINKCLKVILYD